MNSLLLWTILNGLRNEFQFGGRSISRRGKIKKKSLKNITLTTNLPLLVGTVSTNGGEKLSQLFGVKIVATVMYLGLGYYIFDFIPKLVADESFYGLEVSSGIWSSISR